MLYEALGISEERLSFISKLIKDMMLNQKVKKISDVIFYIDGLDITPIEKLYIAYSLGFFISQNSNC